MSGTRQWSPVKLARRIRSPEEIAAERQVIMAQEQCENNLRALLYRFTRNGSDVAELLQETYIRYYEELLSGRRDEVRSTRAFLMAIARNVALDFLRHKQIVGIDYVADMETLVVEDDGADPQAIVDIEQELECFLGHIGRMSPGLRRVFVLLKIFGFAQKEVAAALNLSENTVEQHGTKGARILAGAMGESRLCIFSRDTHALKMARGVRREN